MPQRPGYRLRPCTDSDGPFIERVFGEGRAAEYARWGLAPAQMELLIRHQCSAQSAHYRAHYPEAVQSVICIDGTDVGRVWIDRAADVVYLLDLTLLTAWRGRGIGGALVADVQEEAGASGRRLVIWLSDSEDRRWWQCRGFTACERLDFHQRWEWRRTAPIRRPSGSDD